MNQLPFDKGGADNVYAGAAAASTDNGLYGDEDHQNGKELASQLHGFSGGADQPAAALKNEQRDIYGMNSGLTQPAADYHELQYNTIQASGTFSYSNMGQWLSACSLLKQAHLMREILQASRLSHLSRVNQLVLIFQILFITLLSIRC